MCGAAKVKNRMNANLLGLSPRVWGSPGLFGSGGCCVRSIPTCVGQPYTKRATKRGTRVYPHVCGAAPLPRFLSSLFLGLSPRVWGSHRKILSKSEWMRSIPTCVGQPEQLLSIPRVCEVYPHVCGAANLDSMTSGDVAGLSPRVWGNPSRRYCGLGSARSIPTCVG